jgi:hypothetical protein
MNFRYAMETSDAIRLAGQTVTISFYAKAGANYSSASSNLNTFQYSGTGTNQAAIDMTSWTGLGNTSGTNFTLTTSWQRFTVTQSYASTVKQIGLAFVSTPVGTAGADDSFFITGIQVEAGSVATPFQTASGTLQGELALCQRYLPSISVPNSIMNGFFGGTTAGVFTYSFPVQARVAPTGITVSNVSDWQLVTPSVATGAPTAITWNYGGVNSASVTTTHTAATPTTALNVPGILRVTGASGSILFTGCEL